MPSSALSSLRSCRSLSSQQLSFSTFGSVQSGPLSKFFPRVAMQTWLQWAFGCKDKPARLVLHSSVLSPLRSCRSLSSYKLWYSRLGVFSLAPFSNFLPWVAMKTWLKWSFRCLVCQGYASSTVASLFRALIVEIM